MKCLILLFLISCANLSAAVDSLDRIHSPDPERYRVVVGLLDSTVAGGWLLHVDDTTLTLETIQGLVQIERRNVRYLRLLRRPHRDLSLPFTIGSMSVSTVLMTDHWGIGIEDDFYLEEPGAYISSHEGVFTVSLVLGAVVGSAIGSGLDAAFGGDPLVYHLDDDDRTDRVARVWERFRHDLDDMPERSIRISTYSGSLFAMNRSTIFDNHARSSKALPEPYPHDYLLLRRLEAGYALTRHLEAGLMYGQLAQPPYLTSKGIDNLNNEYHLLREIIHGSGYAPYVRIYPLVGIIPDWLIVSGGVGVGIAFPHFDQLFPADEEGGFGYREAGRRTSGVNPFAVGSLDVRIAASDHFTAGLAGDYMDAGLLDVPSFPQIGLGSMELPIRSFSFGLLFGYRF